MLSSLLFAPAASLSPPSLPPVSASSAFLSSSLSSLSPPPAPSSPSPNPRRSAEHRCEGEPPHPHELLRSADSLLNCIGLKAGFDLNAPRNRNSVECLQGVETRYSDTMHHCVPEWDLAEGDLDVVLESSDLFASSKQRWELGHSRKFNALGSAFVPDHDFEELCWEDGQLVVVMQSLSAKGSKKKSCLTRASDGLALPSETCTATGLTAGDVDDTLDRVATGVLIDSSAANNCAQEDELLSWLQHPIDDTSEKYGYDLPNGSLNPIMWNAWDKVCLRDYMNHEAPLNTSSTASTSRVPKRDFSLNHVSQITLGEGLGDPCSQVDGVASGSGLKGSSVNSVMGNSSTKISESGSKRCRSQVPPPDVQQVMASRACAPHVQPGSPRGLFNFSNFSRPAAAVKANLQSIGMASGPSGTERLKQMDRVVVGAFNAESNNTARNDASLTAAMEQGDALAAAASDIPKSVGASSDHHFVQGTSSRQEADPAMSAEDVDCNLKVVDISHGWNSCITSIVRPGSSDAVEAAEPAATCYSGGSGNAGKIAKGASGGGKRKVHNGDDSESQSKDPEDESGDGKRTAVGEVSSSKRSRAAEIHNQSERRRRDRINEKMKALQELIPNCNKTDKASLLEEAIDYVKTLQTQVQMMSYRSGMSICPLLMPQGLQHVQMAQMAQMPHMYMGMGMGMVDMSAAMSGRHMLPMQHLSSTSFNCPMVPAVPAANLPHGSTPALALPIPELSWTGVPLPGHQLMQPVRPATIPGTLGPPNTSKENSPSLSIPPQQHPFQVINKSMYNTLIAYQPQIPQPSNFIVGSRPL